MVPILFVKQEEEDLVTAHRRQVEETIDIVREVCINLTPLVICSTWLYFLIFVNLCRR